MRCLYQSIAFYSHEVFKCMGVTPDEKHEQDFSRFYTTGQFEGYRVIVTDSYKGGRIYADGTLFIDALTTLTVQKGENKGFKMISIRDYQKDDKTIQVVPYEKYPSFADKDIVTMCRDNFL